MGDAVQPIGDIDRPIAHNRGSNFGRRGQNHSFRDAGRRRVTRDPIDKRERNRHKAQNHCANRNQERAARLAQRGLRLWRERLVGNFRIVHGRKYRSKV